MPLKNGRYKGPHLATRHAILEILKKNGGRSSTEIANELGVTSMAARQQLKELEHSRDVIAKNESRGVGRPTKVWKLTSLSDRHFPDRHRDLMLDLIKCIKGVMGERGMDELLEQRGREQVSLYLKQVKSEASLNHRIKALANIRSQEGYMAETSKEADGSWILIENHCPICSAAKACVGLCSTEMDVFKQTLGENVTVERVEHMLTGDRRCVYRIREVDS
jgi:predicted ArsR family transcriptional regulator